MPQQPVRRTYSCPNAGLAANSDSRHTVLCSRGPTSMMCGIITTSSLSLQVTQASNRGADKLQNFTSHLRRYIPALFLLVAVVPAIAEPASTDLLSGLKWRLIGPFRGGRVVAV